MEDNELIEYYLWGFCDELEGIQSITFNEPLANKAYILGRDHAIIGDDVRSVDYLTNQQILAQIKKQI
jgi:hypothetical protein